jgi:hypothetical protein
MPSGNRVVRSRLGDGLLGRSFILMNIDVGGEFSDGGISSHLFTYLAVFGWFMS